MSTEAESTEAGLGGVGLRRMGWLLGMCANLVLALLPFSSYIAAMPFIQEEWGIGNSTAGVVFSAYLAGYAVVALAVLPLTDRVPLRRVFLCSAAVSTIGNALFPVAAFDPITASILRFLAGAGLVGIYMPGLRLLAREFPDPKRGVAMGLYVTAYYSAGALSLAVTGVLMNSLDWRSAYMALSIVSALSIPLSAALVRGHLGGGSVSGGWGLRIGALASGRVRSYILGYSLHAMELYAVRVWLPALLAAALVVQGSRGGAGGGQGCHDRRHRTRGRRGWAGTRRSNIRPVRTGQQRDGDIRPERCVLLGRRLGCRRTMALACSHILRAGMGDLGRLLDLLDRRNRVR